MRVRGWSGSLCASLLLLMACTAAAVVGALGSVDLSKAYDLAMAASPGSQPLTGRLAVANLGKAGTKVRTRVRPHPAGTPAHRGSLRSCAPPALRSRRRVHPWPRRLVGRAPSPSPRGP